MTETPAGGQPSAVQLAYAQLMSSALPPQTPGQKPSYDVGTVTRSTVAREIRDTIAKQTIPSIFRYAEQPVQIVVADVEAFLDADRKVRAKTARPIPMNPDSVTTPIEAVSSWFKVNAEGAQIPKALPDWIRTLLIRDGIEQFPLLNGIIRHPVISEGKLLTQDIGYDPKSGFIIKADLLQDGVRPETFTDPPEKLLEWLIEEWLGEASFDTRADAMRALLIPATLLFAKSELRWLGKWPAFLISAPDAGTGKSELCHALVEVVTGCDIGDTPWPEKDAVEMQKLLTSLVLADVDVVVWDNLQNGMTLKSPLFDSLVTSLNWSARILGQSRMVEAPSQALHVLTGNNVQPTGDTATRMIEVRLVLKDGMPPAYNRPSLRQWTRMNRASILIAIARVFLENANHGLKQVGRFPGWFAKVAGPLMKVSGQGDLLDHWKVTAPSWDSGALASFLHALKEASAEVYPASDGTAPITIGLMVMMKPDETAALFGIEDDLMEPIYHKLQGKVTPEDQKNNNSAYNKAVRKVGAMVGARLRKHADRSADGMRLRVGKMNNEHGKPASSVRVEMLSA